MRTQLVHEIRQGLLIVRIRHAKSEKAGQYMLSLHRLYRNGEIWHESTRFGRNDILFIRHLLDEAHTWMLTHPSAVEHETSDSQ